LGYWRLGDWELRRSLASRNEVRDYLCAMNIGYDAKRAAAVILSIKIADGI
jgi:hypothetical protein